MRYARRVLAFTWLILIGFIVVTPANDKSPSGKDLYKQSCRVCHDKGSLQGEYSPLTLIQDQWTRFFNTKLPVTHKDIVVPGQSKKLLDALTLEQIKLIQKFCVDHAADSEQPQTCS
jgi:hypothetical protein